MTVGFGRPYGWFVVCGPATRAGRARVAGPRIDTGPRPYRGVPCCTVSGSKVILVRVPSSAQPTSTAVPVTSTPETTRSGHEGFRVGREDRQGHVE